MNFRKASVTYNDLCGEVAIDGDNGPFLREIASIAKVPDTHFPVGFSIWGGEGVEIESVFSLMVAAVKKAEYGESIEMIRDNVKNGTIAVDIFPTNIKLEELFKHIKRIHITAINRSLDECIILGRE